jgi:type IV pilus assembly protein PilO
MGQALDKFLAIPPAQKFLLLLLTLGGIGAIWYFLFISDTQDKIVAERNRTTQLNKQLADAKGLEQNIRTFEEEIEQLKKDRNEMRDRLPEDAEIASLLQKIHGQGKIVGLEIARFERDQMKPEELYVRIPVRMTLVGNFHQIATFFYYVGKLTRIVNVENIELTAGERGRDSTLLQAVCTATTFMYRPPAEGGAAGGAPK